LAPKPELFAMPKIIPPLTANAVEKAHRQSVDRTLSDGAQAGLQLRVGKGGSTWSFQVRANGERRRVTLGSYPDVSLAQARELAGSERRKARATIGGSDATLGLLIEQYGGAVGVTQRSWEARRKTIQNVFGEFEAKPCSALTVRALQGAVDKYSSRAVGSLALTALRPALRWGRKRGWHDMAVMELERPAGVCHSRSRVLTTDELASVLGVLRQRGKWWYDIFTLLLLSACRREEIAGLRWAEIKFDDECVVIPKERYKTNVEMVVPLSSQALGLLRDLRAAQPSVPAGMVFPKQINWVKQQQHMFRVTGTSGWHRHDLRRTAATVLGNMGVEPHIVEVVLGHGRLAGASHGVYNKSRYFDAHKEALQRLANYYDIITQ
jgi:integrase